MPERRRAADRPARIACCLGAKKQSAKGRNQFETSSHVFADTRRSFPFLSKAMSRGRGHKQVSLASLLSTAKDSL
jgi:hypothetical protein